MLGEGDSAAPSNGNRSNGAPTAVTTQSSATNGTRKAALAVNGASNSDTAPAIASQRQSTYFGHDREEVTRILIQALSDMGYQDAAASVSRDSGYELENPTVATFRSAVLNGDWSAAERLLLGAAESESDAHGDQGNGLVLSKGADRNLMRFWIRQQKFLELLEQQEANRALVVLREELKPLHKDIDKLHFLSSLLMTPPTDLKAKAQWDGAAGQSRKNLLTELSRCISPSVMLPANRLAVLLQTIKQSQIDTCLFHTASSSPSLYSDHSCPRERFPTEVALELNDLGGEAWQIQYSPDGSMLAGCGSDRAVIWDENYEVLVRLEGHEQGVGSMAWSPDGSMLVTCSQDKTARLWSIPGGECLKKTKRFGEPVSSCVWAQDGKSFVLGTLDRQHGLCTFTVDPWDMVEWGGKARVQDLCGSRDGRWLVAVDDQGIMRVYSAARRELEYEVDLSAQAMSVSISEDCKHLLVNKSDGEAQLFNLETQAMGQKFLGHTGGKFLIRSSFGGANESFVTSGSEDGYILIWHKAIGAVVERLKGHRPRCNAVVWKPDDPTVLASCGDDGRVKVWTSKAGARALRERQRHPYPGND